MPNKIDFRVGAKGTRQAASEIDKLRDGIERLRKQGVKGFGIGVGAAVTNKAISASFNLVRDAVGAVTGFMGDSVTAYREQEVASGRLNASLKANIAGWNGSTTAMEEANKAGIALGFTDTDTTNSLALLVAATHDEAEAMRVLGVARDLARFKGISLMEASEALTKVEAGSFRVLKSLGIALKDGASQTEALAAVEKVAGGQARQYADTDLGKIDAASAKAEQAQEKLGVAMSHLGAEVAPVLADALTGVTDALDTAGQASNDFITHGLDGWAMFRREVLGIPDALTPIDGGFEKINHSSLKAALGTDGMAAAARKADGSLGGMASAEARAAANAEDLTGAVKGLEDELYGATIASGRIAQAQESLATVLKEEPQKHSGREWRIWKGKVAEARQALFDLQYQEKQKAGPKALYDWLVAQQVGFKNADAKAKAYLATLIRLASLDLPNVNIRVTTGSGIGGVRRFAEGGIVKARPGGTLALIGEAGQDEAVVPIGKGPTAGRLTAPMGGGSVVMNISLSLPNAYGMSPAQGEAAARAFGPALVKYIADRRIFQRAS